MIKTITNLMPSILDLSAVKDVNGNPVTLRPKGSPGDSRDLPEAAWRHDAVERVIEMKWATFGTPVAAPAPEPMKVDTSAADAEAARLAAEAEAKAAAAKAAEEAAAAKAAEEAELQRLLEEEEQAKVQAAVSEEAPAEDRSRRSRNR